MPSIDLTGRKTGGSGTAIAAGAYTSTQNSANLSSNGCRGLVFTAYLTLDADTTATVTPTLQGYDPLTGQYYTIFTGGVITANTTSEPFTQVHIGYPGITVAAGTKFSTPLPEIFRIQMAHSVGSDSWTYSVTYDLVP